MLWFRTAKKTFNLEITHNWHLLTSAEVPHPPSILDGYLDVIFDSSSGFFPNPSDPQVFRLCISTTSRAFLFFDILISISVLTHYSLMGQLQHPVSLIFAHAQYRLFFTLQNDLWKCRSYRETPAHLKGILSGFLLYVGLQPSQLLLTMSMDTSQSIVHLLLFTLFPPVPHQQLISEISLLSPLVTVLFSSF